MIKKSKRILILAIFSLLTTVFSLQFIAQSTTAFGKVENGSTPDSLMTINFGNAETTYHQQQTYISSTAYGMKILDESGSATTGSVSLNSPIDLNAFSYDDYLAEIFPADCAKNDNDIYNSMLKVRITITDVDDASNYLYIDYSNNSNYHCGYSNNNSLAQSWATYVVVYTTGMHEATGSGSDSTTRSGFYRQIASGGASDNSGNLNPYSLRYDAAAGEVKRADGKVHKLNAFNGFASGKVNIKVDFTFNGVGNGIIIKSLGGVDCSETTAIDIAKPVINGQIDEISIFDALPLSTITAEDFFDGDISDKIDFKLNYGDAAKNSLIYDGKIFFDATGDWTLTASVVDKAGNLTTRVFPITVYTPSFDISSPYYACYFTGEKISPVAPKSTFSASTFDYTARLTTPSGETFYLTSDYVFSVAGDYTITFNATVKAEYGGMEKEKAVSIKVIQLNVEDAYIMDDQGLKDIDFGITDDITISEMQLFAASDTTYSSPLSVSKIPAGKYVVKITLFTEGREEAVTFYRNLTSVKLPEITLKNGDYADMYQKGDEISPLSLIVGDYSSDNYTISVKIYHDGEYSNFNESIMLSELGFYTIVYEIYLKDIDYTMLYTKDFEVATEVDFEEPGTESESDTSKEDSSQTAKEDSSQTADSETSEKSGCASSISGNSIFIISTIFLAAVLLMIVKKENSK